VTAPATAVARLHLLRLRLTLLYTLATAVCLVVLAVVAGVIDSRSRAAALDAEVDRSATALSRAVYYDLGTLHLEPLRDDVLASNATPVYVMEWTNTGDIVPRYGSARDTWVPKPEVLRELADKTRDAQETVLLDGTATDGRPLRLAGAPVWNGDQVSATVIAAGDPAEGDADHDALVRDLALVCFGLALLAAAAGHALSGRSMRTALVALDQQEQFLSEAAHELRTPLATLRLVTDGGVRDPDQAPDALRRASRLVDEMGKLVTGLLARARLAAGTQQAEREPLRLDLLVEQVVEETNAAQPTESGEAVEIGVMASPCIVSGDPDLLTQAVRNLLDNAVRHGRGSAVEVVVGEGRITVRDHGPGVAPADRERVFTRSVTGGAGGGTGIGLAIVRWVADLHGGTARLLDADGGGTLAELVLPAVDE
jgi:two-component system OmpR family sensor kinase